MAKRRNVNNENVHLSVDFEADWRDGENAIQVRHFDFNIDTI